VGDGDGELHRAAVPGRWVLLLLTAAAAAAALLMRPYCVRLRVRILLIAAFGYLLLLLLLLLLLSASCRFLDGSAVAGNAIRHRTRALGPPVPIREKRGR
jgi:hypothetical protein